MLKKALALAVIAVFCAAGLTMAAEPAKKAVPASQKVVQAADAARQAQPRPETLMISGKVEKVDASDPANVKITVKNDKDGVSHTLAVMPWTNITKSADISEIKTGETVRIMGRKAQDKEIAMGIMFGKINMPPQRQVPPGRAAAPQGKAQVKK